MKVDRDLYLATSRCVRPLAKSRFIVQNSEKNVSSRFIKSESQGRLIVAPSTIANGDLNKSLKIDHTNNELTRPCCNPAISPGPSRNRQR
jgi:hypothetical protein